MVAETRESGVTVSLVDASPNQLFTWRRLAEQGALTATQAEEEVVPASAFRAQQEQIRELQRLLERWRMRFSGKRSILPPRSKKNGRCGRYLCPRTVRHGNRLRDDRRRALERSGAAGCPQKRRGRPPLPEGLLADIKAVIAGMPSTAMRASGPSCAVRRSAKGARPSIASASTASCAFIGRTLIDDGGVFQGHVWTVPAGQGFFAALAAVVCSHVSGLSTRHS
jgi:transposase-like protein